MQKDKRTINHSGQTTMAFCYRADPVMATKGAPSLFILDHVGPAVDPLAGRHLLTSILESFKILHFKFENVTRCWKIHKSQKQQFKRLKCVSLRIRN